jgi:hypothetical protein
MLSEDEIKNRKKKFKDYMEESKKVGLGRANFMRYLNGERLNNCSSIQAKCYECMFDNDMLKKDCSDPTCPLFPQRPYKEKDNEG